MFLLINTDEMELVAKHPNFLALYNLGIINCPQCQETIPLEQGMFKDFTDSQLSLLFISITCEIPLNTWVRSDIEYLLLGLINQAPETLLELKEVCDQAEYAIKWDIEGYCSFLKGKREPSHDEGLWINITLDVNMDKLDEIVRTKPAIIFSAAKQAEFQA